MMLQRSQLKGATLIEFVVISILMLIFITVAINRIWDLRIAAERTGVESMLGTLRSALGIELIAYVGRKSERKDLNSYNHCNPFKFLDPSTLPTNYLGEYDVHPEQPAPGEWYFNKRDGTLEYRLRFPDRVVNDNSADPALLRFQVQLLYKDIDNNGRFDPATETLKRLDIVSLQDYRWKPIK